MVPSGRTFSHQKFQPLLTVYLVAVIMGLHIKSDDAAKITQSRRCTPEERLKRIQCFDVLPEEQYAVSLGSTVNMQCVVLNQHGKVQWRAKRILLGYDRSIPGYSRYRIIGDVGRGEHTLQIMDVQLDDAGEYECQVTPVPVNNHPLLRKKTELVVLVKPSPPRILYPDVPPPDNQLIISQPDPLIRITVLCVATGGSPPPKFTWILNDMEIPSHPPPHKTRTRNTSLGFWSKFDPRIETKPGTEQSSLSLLKTGLKDGDQLVCSVNNAATLLHHDVQQRNLTTYATVRIHTPPGPPKIITPETNHEYNEGDELRAQCVASPPGNPYGGLFWRWLILPSQETDCCPDKNKPLIARGGARLLDYDSVNAYLGTLEDGSSTGAGSVTGTGFRADDLISEDVQPLLYTLNKEKDRLVNTLTIPSLSRRYHAARLICETGHPVGSAHHTSVKIYVKYPPANVTISVEGGTIREEQSAGHRELVVYGRAGEVKTLICRTSPYYRQATIKWIAQSSDSRSTKPPKQLFGQSKPMRTSDGESFYQESRVQVTITEEDDRSYIDCRVYGDGDNRVDARVRLDIIYPPGTPVITGYKSLQPVKMAHSMELTCITYGGNPAPELSWFKDKKLIQSTGETSVVRRQASSKLTVVPRRDDNGAHYYCSARNAATGTDGVISDSVILNVIFPPQSVVVNFHSSSVAETGQQMIINCLADSSNPVATITWWRFRCGPAHAFAQREARSHILKQGSKIDETTKCKSEEIEGAQEKPNPGAFGGLQAHSRLWLRPTWSYHMDYIECRAENLEYGPPVWHDRLQLNVTFPPQFLGLQSGKEKVIREGQSVKLDLGPYANPPVTAVSWFVNGQLIPQEIQDKTDLQGVFAAGSLGELLALHRINRLQMANYTVTATNGRTESTETFFLNVTYPAGLIGKAEENVTELANDFASLECKATANPAISSRSFVWYRYLPPHGWPENTHESTLHLSEPIPCNQSTVIPTATLSKYYVQCDQESTLNMVSRFTIYRLSEDDVGTYLCQVNNGLGEPVKKTINLFHYFPPSIIRLPRYTKAAGEQGTSVTLTCYIRTEPAPQIGWLKDGNLINVQKTSSGRLSSKYGIALEHIRPGLYKGTLTISNIQKNDFGRYHCQAVNVQGEAQLEITVSGTSTPDIPLNLRLVNSTVDSLLVGWTQGFDGGLPQTFQVRWRQAVGESMHKYADVGANDNDNVVEYLITGLQSGTEYLVSVNSKNEKHGASVYTDPIHIRTESLGAARGGHLLPPLSSGQADDNALLIIVAACVFGFVVLVINLVVISFLIKRRRQRRRLMRHGKPEPDSILVNSLVHRDGMGEFDSKAGGRMPQGQTTESFTTESTEGCSCCPQSRGKPMTSTLSDGIHLSASMYCLKIVGYVKADSLGTFTRPNGHVTQFYTQPGTQSTQKFQYRTQQPQVICGHHVQENVPDFGHFSTNQIVGGFAPQNDSFDRHPLSMASPVPLNPTTSGHFTASELGSVPLDMFNNQGSIPGALLSQQQPRPIQSPQLNQYTPRQAAAHSRCAGTIRNLSNGMRPSLDGNNSRSLNFDVTLPRNSALVTLPNSELYTNHSSTCFDNSSSLISSKGQESSLDQGLADTSRNILSTGLAAFTQLRRHNEKTDQFLGRINCQDQQNPSQLVSVKFADIGTSFPHGNGTQLTSLPPSLCSTNSVEYSLPSTCTPLLLSLDPNSEFQLSAPEPILMTNSVMREPASSNGFFKLEGTLAATPLIVQAPENIAYSRMQDVINQSNSGDD
ncbi:unnamed protein product [Calicophoron daubneyi]|uniref:Nephrin n=1 Tax=Calicophoron daubneyi TaxID=300641 RepID=A0AAV2TP34_CALDB